MDRERTSMERPTALQRATQLIQAGNVAAGAALCRDVLAREPGQPDALHLLAMATRTSDPRAAEALFRESLQRAPLQPNVLVNYANFLRASGRTDEAEPLLRRATELAPEWVPGWYNLGILLRATNRLGEAAHCANRCTTLDPAHAAGWELRAAIEQQRRDLDAAIALCRAGLANAPRSARLHYSLGQLLREDCRFADAAPAYEAALALGHETAELYPNWAEALLETGNGAAALAVLAKGISRHPRDARLHRLCASLHWATGTAGDPIAPLWHAAREHPGDPALWETLIRILVRLGRPGEADAAIAEAGRRGCPRTADIAILEALGRVRSGDTPAATPLFERALRDYPRNAAVQLAFAEHLLSSGDPARAESLCADVLAADPFEQLAWAHRGIAWQLLGDPRRGWLLDYERMVLPVAVQAPAEYPDRDAFFRQVLDVIEALHRTRVHPLDQSVRGGTQTNGYLFRLKEPTLQLLQQQIRAAVRSVLAGFPDDSRHPFWGRRSRGPDAFRFSGCWSVRLLSQGYHTNHMHPEGWISSALYVALPDEVSNGVEGRAGHIEFGVPPREMNLALPPQRTVQPRVGELLLFPSYMWHGTVPFTARQPRVTVAFDVVPHG